MSEKVDEVVAYILVLATAGGAENLVEVLRKDEKVEEAHIVYGDVDIVAKVRTKDLPELTNWIMSLRKRDQVKKTNTLIAILD
ncbi:MAG: Lrp/AsnC ligand binding domain-containing protein [Promethearchaeota archaeon]